MRAVVAVVVSTALCSVALAHGRLESASPSPGAVVIEPPREIVLRFDSEVERGSARFSLRLPDGSQRALDSVEGDGLTREMIVPVGPLGTGEHHLLWSVTCRDGHRLAGSLRFTVRYRYP